MKVCSADNCLRPHDAKGWCKRHYMSWRRASDPEFARRQRDSARICHRRKASEYRIGKIRKTRESAEGFLKYAYLQMQARVRGNKGRRSASYYKHLPIMGRAEFISRSLADAAFLRLYRRWQLSDFELRLRPVPDHDNTNDRGYVWANIEWVTYSENCSRAATLLQNRRAA